MNPLMIIKWIESFFASAAPLAEQIATDVESSGADATAHKALAAHLKQGASVAATAVAAPLAGDSPQS